jgi:hypothetical protein
MQHPARLLVLHHTSHPGRAMPAQSAPGHAPFRLKRQLARVRARIEHLEMIAEHNRRFVVEARLTAAKQRLAELSLERRRLRDELQV